jgi:peptidoglycan/LPS O-acetylase OafA/YrhL
MVGFAVHGSDRIVHMAQTRHYRPDIDGMRAIAVLSVVAYHYGLSARGGFIGVDVFFVISGYLIGSLIYQQAIDHNFDYPGFYARRARRILPALLAVLGLTYAVMLLLATPADLREYASTATATLLSVSNIQLWRSFNYFHPTAELNPLLMTWSLGVEEQFYLFAPLLVLALAKIGLRWRLLALGGVIAVSLGLATWGVRHQPGAAFFLLPARAWELAAGVLVGVLEIHGKGMRTRRWLEEANALAGLLLIIVPALTYGRQTPFPGLGAVPPVLGTVLLLNTTGSTVNRRLLAWPAMRAVGLVSYSLYLWHWPLISMARLFVGQQPASSVRWALLALSGVLAAASYRYVETPLRRARTPARSTLLRYGKALAVSMVLVASALLADGYPQRWSPQFVAEARQFDHRADPCLALHHDATPNTSGVCYPSADRLVAVVGDSHAAALAPGLRKVAAGRELGLVQLTKASCQFLVGVSPKVTMHPELMHDCAAFDRKVMDLLLEDPHIGAVIIAGAWRAGPMRPTHYVALDGRRRPTDTLLADGLAQAVHKLEGAGKRVFIARDVPFLRLDPRARLAACASWVHALWREQGTAENCGRIPQRDTVPDAPALAILARVAKDTGAPLVDPRIRFCDESGCRIAEHGHTLYFDRQHLSPLGSSVAGKAFEPLLDALVASH